LENIGSFSSRARAPVPADVLIDVWLFKEGHCGIELNIHPDDLEDVSTCVMISGQALADLAEAVALINTPQRKVSHDNVVSIVRQPNKEAQTAPSPGGEW
jgi:hypothetical protein